MFEKTGFLKKPGEKKPRERYLVLFLVAFFGMLVAFIPTMIDNDGIFLYYGDFNSQQVMFYEHANDMVREGNFGWDWGTDLGSNFIGSYSFYLLGSPFFWLSTIFPQKAVVFLLPWLLSLKTAVAAVTAYAYIRRFVENRDACFMGAMLYAFSGFQVYNVFFNHFHDVTAFFPLLLLGFELLVKDHKKGAFAIAVGICASISYFFFACEVVFLIIYFFVRLTDKDLKMTWKTFGLLVLESVLGVMLSAVIFLPSCIDVLTNPRLESRLYGLDMVVYSENVRIPRIIQAFFMVSDMPARVNLLASEKARWASIAGYLPLFSMCGVIAYMRTRKKNWANKLIIICIIMAFVPVLNSTYVMFNGSYYARWFYMPILIMCLMTAKVIDENPDQLKKGLWITVGGGLFFVAIGLLPKQENGETVWGKIAKYPDLYTLQAVLTVLFIAALILIVYFVIRYKKATAVMAVMTSAACVVYMFTSIQYGSQQGEYVHYKYITNGIYGEENLNLEKLDTSFQDEGNDFYRIDTSQDVDNWCMFWGLSTMRTFHSVVPSSIMEFYDSIGQTRDVASRMDTDLYALRGLFSVRYYFSQLTDSQINGTAANNPSEYMEGLQGFKYVDTQNGFNIYENENWVPMGFAFDEYTTDEVIQSLDKVDKTNILMEALVLEPEQIAKYSDVMSKYDETKTRDRVTYTQACKEKQAKSCYYFEESSDGFDAKIKLDSDSLVFFSVPYDQGWSASVNGQEVDIEKVDYGFMAVLCKAGDNVIRFDYQTTGLTAGKIITVTGFVVLVAYMGTDFYFRRKRNTGLDAKELSNKTDK